MRVSDVKAIRLSLFDSSICNKWVYMRSLPQISFITNFIHSAPFSTINSTQSYHKTEHVSCSHILRGPVPSQVLNFTNMFYFQQQLPGNQESSPALEGGGGHAFWPAVHVPA